MNQNLREHFFITLPTMVGVSYFVFWACALPNRLDNPEAPQGLPAINAPAPLPSIPEEEQPRSSGEVGFGVVAGFGSATTFDPNSGAPSKNSGAEGGGLFWLGKGALVEQKFAVSGGVMFSLRSSQLLTTNPFDFGEGASLGVYARVMRQAPRLQIGPAFSGGFSWASGALPAMFQVNEKLWLYTNPTITAGRFSELQLPIGGAVRGQDGTFYFGAGVNLAERNRAVGIFGTLGVSFRPKSKKPTLSTEEALPVKSDTPPTTSKPVSMPTSTGVLPPSIVQPSSVPAFEP